MFRLRRIAALRWLWRIPVTVPVRSDPPGFTAYVDLFRNFRLVYSGMRAIEADERKAFDMLIERFRPRVFWDVGANVGIYSLQFLARVPGGTVVAFEPDRRNIGLLARTVRKNRFKDLTVVPRAVGERSGEAEFFLDDITGATGTINPAQLFIAKQYGQVPNRTTVPVTTFDDEFRVRPGPDIVKIDVEGAELAAMTGGRSMFAQSLPAILYEASGRSFRQTREFLEALGYRLFDATTVQPIVGPTQNVIALHRDKHLQGGLFIG